MSKAAARSVTHGTFVIERELPYPPARVFAEGTKGLIENLAKYLEG